MISYDLDIGYLYNLSTQRCKKYYGNAIAESWRREIQKKKDSLCESFLTVTVGF